MSGEQTTFAAIVERWARERAACSALRDEAGATLAWSQLGETVAGIRGDLRALGVGRQARIAVALPPSPRSALLFTALVSSATLAPMSPDLPAAELDALLPRLGLAAVIHPAEAGEDRLAEAARRAGVPVIEGAPAPGDPFRVRLMGPAVAAAVDDGPVEPSGLGIITSTSGTTGRPKLVARTHGELAGVMHRGDPLLPVEPDWRTIVFAPLSLSLGMTALRRALADGSLAVIPDSFDPARLPSLMDAHDPAWLFALPQAIAALANAHAAGDWRPGPSLRYLRSTSARLDPAVREALPVPVFDAYASAEAGMVAREGFGVPHRPGCVGRIEARVRIVDDGREQPEGAPGEIQVSGPRVFRGYLDDPEATAQAFTEDGWFRTGDLGCLQDGYLALLGRIDDRINSGGVKIDPEAIERALAQWPGIVEAAAFGAPHPRLGQEPAAAIVLAPGAVLDRRALRRWLIERLGPSATPKRIDIRESLPRTLNGKLSRSRLAGANPPADPS